MLSAYPERTFVMCFSFENDKNDKEVYDDHVARFEQYKVLKKEMLQKKNVLHNEFDFGQNLPCPKIPVNSQFYCRLLWLYIFNVHVHHSSNSYMFHFVEGTLKIGENTVCNLVYYAISVELKMDCYIMRFVCTLTLLVAKIEII